MIHPSILIVVLTCLTQPVFAGLTWESREAKIDAKLGDTEAKTSFTFTNDGDKPVTITSVKTSCGCTTAELAKNTYAPGESGVITASFSFGDRRGDQVKRIVVRTDDEQSPVATLTFRVAIPEVLRVRPRLVYWRSGEDAAPKTVQVEIVSDKPVRILAAKVDSGASEDDTPGEAAGKASGETSGGGAFTAEVREVEKGKRYEVVLTPTSVDKVVHAPIRLVTDLPEEKDKDFEGFSVMARILPGAGTPGTESGAAAKDRADDASTQAKAE